MLYLQYVAKMSSLLYTPICMTYFLGLGKEDIRSHTGLGPRRRGIFPSSSSSSPASSSSSSDSISEKSSPLDRVRSGLDHKMWNQWEVQIVILMSIFFVESEQLEVRGIHYLKFVLQLLSSGNV